MDPRRTKRKVLLTSAEYWIEKAIPQSTHILTQTHQATDVQAWQSTTSVYPSSSITSLQHYPLCVGQQLIHFRG